MNNLPDPILDTMYRYKNQLELKHVLDELTGTNQNLYFSTKRELIRYLRNNINKIEWIILNDSKRMCALDYLKILCRSRNKLLN